MDGDVVLGFLHHSGIGQRDRLTALAQVLGVEKAQYGLQGAIPQIAVTTTGASAAIGIRSLKPIKSLPECVAPAL